MEWDSGTLKVSFARLDRTHRAYSSAREASGLLHLVVLLAALYDDEIDALLIDEPEVSLHPQLQSFLFREIQKVSGDPEQPGKKIVFLATHSPEMVDFRTPEDITSILFCHDIGQTPNQVAADAPELQSRKLRALLTRLAYEHKSAFFCSRPVLVEGPSDQIICSALDRHLDIGLSAANAHLMPVIGKDQIPVVVKLFRLIGKTPVVLVDCDGFSDGLSLVNSYSSKPEGNAAANEKGHADAAAYARTVHSDFCSLVAERWDDISAAAMQQHYWVNRDATAADDMLFKRRAALAALMGLTERDLEAVPNHEEWSAMRVRLESLFDFLEAAGCFVLRKGTIESYYQFQSTLQAVRKPEAAVAEAEGICAEDAQFARANYGDVIRALEFAGECEDVDEARPVRQLVLAVAAPALAEISPDTASDAPNLMARSLLGDKASLITITPNLADPDDLRVVVELNSDVLDVSGFPLELSSRSNPIEEVTRSVSGPARDTGATPAAGNRIAGTDP